MLLLLGSAVGGGYVWYLWSNTDELLHGRIAQAFQESVPDWGVSFRRARFDFQGQVRVYDFALKIPETDADFINLPETIVSVDREQLGQQRLVFKQIRLMQPRLDLVRDGAGHWNWEGFGKLPESEGNLPELIIERGSSRLTACRLAIAVNSPAALPTRPLQSSRFADQITRLPASRPRRNPERQSPPARRWEAKTCHNPHHLELPASRLPRSSKPSISASAVRSARRASR